MAKNLHLEHPEDLILTGDMSVLDWFSAVSTISVKMDGAPAIVWGTNPENGRFFVGTKSVFNKKKIKICYTTQDIVDHYPDQVGLQVVLKTCFDFLPRTEQIIQGDFIGYGGCKRYKPNTITYEFPEQVDATVIVAPHTIYTGDNMSSMCSSPLTEHLESNEDVLFVQPAVDCIDRFKDVVDSIRESVSQSKFLTETEAKEAKIIINAFIREGKSLSPSLLEEILGDWELMVSYFQIVDLKEQMIDAMHIYDGPKAFIGDQPIECEGFVRTNKYGTMKLVDRYVFARANFNNKKFS